MNHINWIQQDPDYKTEYHVLKWGTSHFHEPQARRMVDSALHKEGAACAVSPNSLMAEAAEIGFGLAFSVKSGGFVLSMGQEGASVRKNPETERGQDVVTISGRGAERQSGERASQTVRQQTPMTEDLADSNILIGQTGHPELYDTLKAAAGASRKVTKGTEAKEPGRTMVAAATGQGSIRSRLKESAAQLRQAYQRQKEKIKDTVLRSERADKRTENPKKGTREADREETLSMQAQNHYLLDSYDRNGRYHTLGSES